MAFDHRGGTATANPYAPVMGRTFVALDEAHEMTVLDPPRAATLLAWVARVIPGDAHWPSAADVDTVDYIDAVLTKASELRPVILAGVDAARQAAVASHNRPFVDLPPELQTEVLRVMESQAAPEAFSVILELTYEAYYRSVAVQDIAQERTGFNVRNTLVGKPMDPFPTEQLLQVGNRPDNYRRFLA